jgi:hypothetical protein
MHVAVDSDGGDEFQVEDAVRDSRDTQEEERGGAKEEDIQVYTEGGLGEQ